MTAGAEMMVPLDRWPAPALVIDGRGRIVAANAAMSRCLGAGVATLVGTTLAAWALDEAKLADFLRKGSASPSEIRFRASDGSARLLALSIARRAVPAGDVLTALDVTLYRAGEGKLREERDRYLDMIRAASDWFYETETTRQTETEVEARICIIRGRRDGGLQQYEIHTKWPGGIVDRSYDPEGLAAHMKKIAAHEPFRDVTHRQAGADGTKRYLRASGVPYLRDGSHVGYRGVSSNVTAQVLAEQALQRERRHLEAAQRLAGFGSVARDLATGAESWSPELCHLLGIEPAAAASPAKSVANFVHDADRAWLRAAVAGVEAGERVLPAVIRIVQPSGATRRLEAAIELLRDAGGKPDSLLMVFKDATPR